MMIHKLDGSFNINKLRVIHIFEADYNGVIGILFNRRVLYQAERRNLLNNNQWGGRPHRQAEDALMLKELTYNITNNTKTTLATFDNDATGCFDRVPCTVAMLSSRRLGATKNICRMQADTLQNIKHKLRTAFGTSLASYTSSDECEIHGQGQGSRAGPPTWVFVSSLLLDCMEKLANGLHFTCPDKELHHRRTNDAFVDDVTGYTNQFVKELDGNQVQAEVLHMMQCDATLWSQLLHISGGKLALHKCLYYLVAWKWNHGIATQIPANTIHPKIHLQDEQQSTAIRHLNCNQAHRTLGQYKAPDGSQSSHLSYMQRKSTSWLTTVQQASLSKPEAEAAYKMLWFPSLSYGTGTTNLSYKDLDRIQKPIVNHILPLLGYNRHLPRAVVFGSKKFGGLNLKHLYIDQGTKHVTNFIKYYRNGGSIGELIKISLRWLHLIAGFSFCPLARPQANYHHIEDRWYQTTIRFLHQCNAHIETDTRIRILCRENDSSLMEDFLLTNPSPRELKQLNSCRLFLRVTTLSDICNARGNKIIRQCWEGTTPRNATQLWPTQAKPPTNYWSLWRKYLSRCYLADESSTRKNHDDLHLASPLGPWIPKYPQRHVWEFRIHPVSLTLYRNIKGTTWSYTPCRNTRRQIEYRCTNRTNYCPNTTIPIDCTHSHNSHDNPTVQKSDIPRLTPQHKTKTQQFNDYINTLDYWERQLLQNLQFHLSPGDTVSMLTQPIIIGSDGSVSDGRGSFGWIIANPQAHVLATGSGIAFGFEVTSFRSEAYGILAPLRLLYHLQCFHQFPLRHRSITWYCDSESLLKRVDSNIQDTPNPNRYKLADNDLEIAITHTIPLVSTILHRHHIRSHQHDHVPLHQLPIPQRLNRMADELAASVHKNQTRPTNKVPLITLAGCQLHTQHGTITRSYTRTLHDAFTHQQTSQHICHRLGIHTTSMSNIAWLEFDRAFKSLPTGTKRTIRRWIFGYLPTQRRLARYKQSPSALCPTCRQHDETDMHFLTCGGSTSWQTYLFEPMKQLFHKLGIHSTLDSYIASRLRSFLDHGPIDDSLQLEIGWNAIFTGLFNNSWIEYINQHTNPPTGSALVTKLIRLILTAVAERWNIRCHQLHQTQQPIPETKARLINQVQALYMCQHDVLKQDRHIFAIPLTDMIQRSTTYLKGFITQYGKLIKRSIRLQQDQIKRQHRDISTYFVRRTTRGSL